MAANLLVLTFEDAYGGQTSLQANIKGTVPENDAELLDMIQQWVDMSNATLLSAKLSVDVDISALTNPAASSAGSYDNVRDQAVLQWRRDDATGFVRTTVPAPKDAIFAASGSFAQADVDTAQADVAAFRTAAIDAPITKDILVSPQETTIDLQKGWRKGQKHS